MFLFALDFSYAELKYLSFPFVHLIICAYYAAYFSETDST